MSWNNIYKVIKGPVLTEKTNILKESGKYTFEVYKDVNKMQVKYAVQQLFKVSVVSVNMLRRPPKNKRLGRFSGKTSARKMAIVTLKPGQTITELEGV